MHTVFTLQISVSIVAFDVESRRFNTGLIPFLIVGYGNLISIRLRPTRIHTEQHGSPVLAFRTAGTGVDLQHTTHLVGFLTQHIAELQAFHQLDGIAISLVNFFFADDSFFYIIISQLQFFCCSMNLVIKFDPLFQFFYFLHLDFRPFSIFPETRIMSA